MHFKEKYRNGYPFTPECIRFLKRTMESCYGWLQMPHSAGHCEFQAEISQYWCHYVTVSYLTGTDEQQQSGYCWIYLAC